MVTDPNASGMPPTARRTHRPALLLAIIVAIAATALVAAVVLFWPKRSTPDSPSSENPS
jgi:hypothetical protein